MQKYSVTTLGCKVNQFESEAIIEFLNESNWTPTEKSEEADVCIINTCTVTQKASMQSRQAIRQAIKSNPYARIIVTGCYAQTGSEEIKKIDGVHDIIGHSLKHRIPNAVISSVNSHLPSSPKTIIRDIGKEHYFKQIPMMVAGTRTRPFLKIQDGCSASCTYCIVPYTRGPSRSMPYEDVLEKIDALKNAGYRETVLTGIHLGAYGQDLSSENGLLPDLLKRIIEANSPDRIRLSSIEPNELTTDIIKYVASSDCLCHHFHIPLQSGSDKILQKMKRPYSASIFRDLMFAICKAIPDAAIGCDVLVGFPGESEEDFENTYLLIEGLPITYLHVFPFSPRKGTKAYNYPNQISPDIIKERCTRIRKLGLCKKKIFYEKSLGKMKKVLIEGKRDRDTGFLKGLTSNYITVLTDGPDYLKNAIVKTKIEKMHNNVSVIGTVVG